MAGYPENRVAHLMLDEIIDVCKRQGVGFETSIDTTLSGNDSLETIFITGDKPVVFYSRKLSYNGDGINALIYRDPTYTGGDDSVFDINNPNDINAQESQCSFVSDATITDDGTISRAPIYVFGSTTNQSQGDALQVIDDPQIMPPNSKFLFVLESRDGQSQDVASILQWVEPDRIPGIVLNNNGTFDRYNGLLL